MKSGVTRLGAAERDVRRLAERPAAAAVALQPLLGADAVDRQLQRARLVRRPTTACSRSAGTCRRRADRADRPRPSARSCAAPRGPANVELAAELVLEQPLDDVDRPLGLHAEHRLRRGRPRPAIRAAACARAPPRPRRAPSVLASTTSAKQRARRVEIVRRDRRDGPRACHVVKNASNTSCTKLPCRFGSITSSSSRSSSRRMHVLREILERTRRGTVSRALTDTARGG